MRFAFEAGLGAATVSVIGVARHSRAWFGVTVAVAAGAAFAIANTSAGVAYQGGSNPLTVASTRFLLPTAALIAWLRVTRVYLVLPKSQAIVAILLGAVTALYNWALLKSFNSIPFALAVLIIYLYPLIAAVIVAGFGWDKFAWRTGAAIAVAFIGLALALDVRGSHLEISGVILAFLAAVGLAIVVAVSSRVFWKWRCTTGDPLHVGGRERSVVITLCAERRLCITADKCRVDRLWRSRRVLRLRDNHLFHCDIYDRTSARVALFLFRRRYICLPWCCYPRPGSDDDPGRRHCTCCNSTHQRDRSTKSSLASS